MGGGGGGVVYIFYVCMGVCVCSPFIDNEGEISAPYKKNLNDNSNRSQTWREMRSEATGQV